MRLFLVLLLSASIGFGAPYYPPSDRITDWLPGTDTGIVGGIDQYISGRTDLIDVTQAPYNADNTGASDAQAAIQSAINAATSGQVVYFPAGSYRVDSALATGYKDSITLRGASEATTTIVANFGGGGTLLYVGGDESYQWNPDLTLSAPASKGDTVLTFTSTAGISGKPNGGVGCLARISILNQNDNAEITAGAVPVVHVMGYERQQCQMVRIAAVTGTTVTLEDPLTFDMPLDLVPQIAVANQWAEKVGIENLTFELSNSGAANIYAGLRFVQTVECWIYKSNFYRANNYNVYITDSYKPEIYQSRMRYLRNQADQGDSNRASLLYGRTGNGLIVNNIFSDCFPLIEMNSGCTGNAFLLNFGINSYAYSGPGIGFQSNHGPHNTANLWEGNITTSFMSDGYFGGESLGTWARNWVTGSHKVGEDYRGNCLTLKRFSRNFNFIGNVLGTNGLTAFLTSFGYPFIGNSDYTGTAEPSTGDFWIDWKATGELTTRTSDTLGVITMDGSYSYTTDNLMYAWWNSHANLAIDNNMVVSGSAITFTVDSGSNLPILTTSMELFGGPNSFYELDLDVEPSTLEKVNYNTNDDGIPSGQDLDPGDTLPNSYAYTSQPGWWPASGYAWPPIDPFTPNMAYTALPAGYAYVNGSWPGGGSGTSTATVSGTTTVTGTLTPP